MQVLTQESRDLLDDRGLRTMWDVHDEWGEPSTDSQPYVWKWEEVNDSLHRIENEAPLDELPQGIRRSLALTPPGMNITSPTIAVFYQTVTPGEEAGAHRHNVGAFRFVTEGSDQMYTVVEGERFPMKRGDLVLTPNWTYHDHVNEGDERAVWVDVLDWPFVGEALKAPIFENHKEFRQPVDKPDGHFNSQFGRLRPARSNRSRFRDAPPYRFPWEDAYRSLRNAADADEGYDPYNGYNLEYVNPETGHGPTMSTVQLRLQLLEPDQSTESHRHNTNEIYYAVKGSGTTTVGDVELDWAEKDSFVVPPGEWHSHAADADEAVLFAISDYPIYDTFNLYHEETDDSAA